VIEVPDLELAASEYELLVGPLEGSSVSLANVTVELHEVDDLQEPRIAGLVLLDDSLADGQVTGVEEDTRGLSLERRAHRSLSAPRHATATGLTAVDHIVLMTGDADGCIRLFGDEGLGMRLALDQLVPEWGGRMLFFRCGKLTLEVIQRLEDPPPQDFFWGITYFSPSLEKTLGILDEAGVEHSPIREGRKPGTRVATVKSHNLGLPTLLIEPARESDL
jgi:catechol 2,3-dioxygenase-like lactoylglutathione lyase family enzyme